MKSNKVALGDAKGEIGQKFSMLENHLSKSKMASLSKNNSEIIRTCTRAAQVLIVNEEREVPEEGVESDREERTSQRASLKYSTENPEQEGGRSPIKAVSTNI